MHKIGNRNYLASPRLVIVLSGIITAIIGSNLFFVVPKSLPNPSTSFTNPSSCRPCHQAITDSFMRTAHYFDSRPADSKSIKGSFEEGKNSYKYNQFMEVVMVKEGNQYLQSGRVNGMETVAAPFDIVIGSGRNGQTYFTWSENQLFQLPVSYYAPARQWCNSPGFPNFFHFERLVSPNCLECHTSYTKVLSHETKEYDRSSIVYGITCERCHPGSAEHAAFQTANPQQKTSKFVVNAAHLDRQLRMDACALCHSGLRTPLQPPFSYKVGDALQKYSVGEPPSQKADTLDVHGNQYGLLVSSQCYIKSAKMDCSTCHDVHNNQFQTPKLFSAKCISCHANPSHPSIKINPSIMVNDCISCHMPVLASKKIQLNVKPGQQLLPDYLRTHYISIYKDATTEFLKRRK
jgi:Cytochrome c554 and c-prime